MKKAISCHLGLILNAWVWKTNNEFVIISLNDFFFLLHSGQNFHNTNSTKSELSAWSAYPLNVYFMDQFLSVLKPFIYMFIYLHGGDVGVAGNIFYDPSPKKQIW